MNKMVLLSFVVFVCLSSAKSSTVNLSSGLVGDYQFSGNSQDSSGNNNHGTVFSASLTTDRFGNTASAYSFNGIDSYISLGNQAAFNFGSGSFSISTWVKLNSAQNDMYFVSKYSGGGPGYGVGLGWNSSGYGLDGGDVS